MLCNAVFKVVWIDFNFLLTYYKSTVIALPQDVFWSFMMLEFNFNFNSSILADYVKFLMRL